MKQHFVDDDPRLTPVEVGRILRKDPKAVRVMCELGDLVYELETYPSGRVRYYIRASVVEAWRDTHTRRRGRAW